MVAAYLRPGMSHASSAQERRRPTPERNPNRPWCPTVPRAARACSRLGSVYQRSTRTHRTGPQRNRLHDTRACLEPRRDVHHGLSDTRFASTRSLPQPRAQVRFLPGALPAVCATVHHAYAGSAADRIPSRVRVLDACTLSGSPPEEVLLHAGGQSDNGFDDRASCASD